MWSTDLCLFCYEGVYLIFRLLWFFAGLSFGCFLLYVFFGWLELRLGFVVLFMHPLTKAFREFLCACVCVSVSVYTLASAHMHAFCLKKKIGTHISQPRMRSYWMM